MAGERNDINVLRGLAAAYMVIHHVWAELAQEIQLTRLGEAIVFVGSCAPVAFFFVTGMGYGAQGDRSGALSGSAWKKIIALLLADQLLFLRSGSFGILEFLGFIALSALLLEGIVRTRRPMLWAAAIAGTAMVLRYGLGSSGVPERLGLAHSDWFNVLVGAKAVDGLVYPVLPWVVYPCLGFIAARVRRPSLAMLVAAMIALAAPAALAAAYLVRGGRAVFRFGTVSLSFVLLSIVVLAASICVATLIERSPRWSALTSIRGIASLAVVPIHYLLIQLCASTGLVPSNGLELAALTALVMVLTFAASHAARAVIERSAARRPAPTAALAIASFSLSAAALLASRHAPLVGVALMAVGQLGLSIALAVPLSAAFQLGQPALAAGQRPKAR